MTREWIWSDILNAVDVRNCNHTFIGPSQKVAICPVPSVAVMRAFLTAASASVGLTNVPCSEASHKEELRTKHTRITKIQIPIFKKHSCDMAEATKPSGSWTDAFPAPRTTAPTMTREEALSALSSPELLIVDVRRTDYEGGTIKGSVNLPAHSFYMNQGVLFDLCKRAGVKKVAFYCGE